MAFEFKKIAEQTLELWKKLSLARKGGLLAAALVTIGLIAFLAMHEPEIQYQVLFSGLPVDDAAKVVELLKAQGTPYKLTSGGTTIEVPTAQVHELRLSLAASGLPRGGGIGFEVFDKEPLGTTSFVEQMNYRRALQGELQRTVMSIAAVEKARIHIAMRERSLYREDDEPPTASVALHLRPGRQLSGAQIRGVVHLVASSVEGLRAERVTVVDENGKVLWSGDESTMAATATEQQHEMERTLSRRITEIVERVTGSGHAVVEVTAEMDYARKEHMEEIYDKDKEAIRSESRTVERPNNSDANAGGTAGARGNLPGTTPPNPAESDETTRLSETRNYEVNKTVTKVIDPVARIKRLHVAVLVDGMTTDKGFVPRSAEELSRVASLAREAAGLDSERGDKIEVHSVPFAREQEPVVVAPKPLWPLSPPITSAIGAGLAALMVLGVMLVNRRRQKGKAASAPQVELPLLPVSVGELEAAMSGKMPPPELPAPSARERAMMAARHDVARAAKVLSSWLAENTGEGQRPATVGGAA